MWTHLIYSKRGNKNKNYSVKSPPLIQWLVLQVYGIGVGGGGVNNRYNYYVGMYLSGPNIYKTMRV